MYLTHIKINEGGVSSGGASAREALSVHAVGWRGGAGKVRWRMAVGGAAAGQGAATLCGSVSKL